MKPKKKNNLQKINLKKKSASSIQRITVYQAYIIKISFDLSNFYGKKTFLLFLFKGLSILRLISWSILMRLKINHILVRRFAAEVTTEYINPTHPIVIN